MSTLNAFRGHTARKLWGRAAVLTGCWLVLFLMHFNIQPYSDDLVYMQHARDSGLFAFLGDFYMTWSGRVTSNALCWLLLGHAFWLWKVLNPLIMIALSYGMARAVCAKPSLKTFFAALLLLFVLGPGILDYAAFWATGSLYYLWPAAAGLFVMMPFLDLTFRDAPRVRWFPLRVAAALLAGMCNEQLTLCLLGFAAVMLVDQTFLKKKRVPKHWVLFGALAVSALVMFAAPGGASRYSHEARVYLAEYGTLFTRVPLGEKLANGLAWMYDLLFYALYLVLMLLFALAWYGRYRKGTPPQGAQTRGRLFEKYALFALLCFSVVLCFPNAVDGLFNFQNIGALLGLGSLVQLAAGLVPYAYWTLFLAALFYLLARKNFYYALGLVAALCTLIVMFFSPTLYFSGERTLFAAGVLFIILMLGFLKDTAPTPFLIFLACLAAVNTGRLFSRLTLFWGAF